MSFLTWPMAALAAAIAIPSLLILYFLKLRRRDLEVSTTLLWRKAIQDMQANAPFQKLRRNILLFLQLLILAALLFAIAQPQLSGMTFDGGRYVILIDRSASMQTADADEPGDQPMTRLALAKQQAIEFVEGLEAGSLLDKLLQRDVRQEAMVVAFDTGAQIMQQFTANKALLSSAIKSIAPSEASTDFTAAARLTDAIIGAQKAQTPDGQDIQYEPGVPAVMWSDGAIRNLDELDLHPESTLVYNRVGAADTVNYAITAMRADRTYDNPNQVAVFVGVQSTAMAPVKLDVEFAVNGVVAGVKEISLPAAAGPDDPATSGAIFRLNRTDSAIATATIVEQDALLADNSGYLVLPPARRLAVALVSRGNLFLEAALNDMYLSEFQVLRPGEFEALRDEGGLEQFDVMILDQYLPEDVAFGTEDPDGGMPPGRYLTYGVAPPIRGIAPPAAEGKDDAGGVVAAIDWERRHPALSYVNFDSLLVFDAIDLQVDEAGKVLVRGTEGPLIAEAFGEQTRAIVVGFAPLNSTWVMEPGFILFLVQAIRYLGEDFSGLTGQILHPGEIISTRIPPGPAQAQLRQPSGQRADIAVGADGQVSYGPIGQAGVYELSWAGEPGPRDAVLDGRAVRAIAVNLFDPVESRVASMASIKLPTGTLAAANTDGGERLGIRRLWPWCILAALGVMLLEWFIYNRKVQL